MADNRWPPLLRDAIAAAGRWGVPAVVDVEAPCEADALQGATHLAFSMQGLADFAPGLDRDNALRRAAGDYRCWVAVTDGAEGVWFTKGESIAHIPAFAVEAVDTLGAGDVWHGLFALRLAEGADERTAIRFANAGAALKCRTFGGVAGCPDRAATEAFLRESETCN
ncbi:MAG: hypothetical protein D6754_04135 [Alphaproteobacteria bacterium]|nr:MAG: hypothetical protein D6754_04135 [Alphaproteobacteria bacterium]